MSEQIVYGPFGEVITTSTPRRNPRRSTRKDVSDCSQSVRAKRIKVRKGPTKEKIKAEIEADIEAKRLFDSGTINDPICPEGRTPLLHAAQWNNLANVKALLKNGANLTCTEKGGNTALMLAAKNNRHAIVKLLLEERCLEHANLRNDDGLTALMWASMFGHVETVELLCKNQGYQANLTDNYRGTAMTWATSRCHHRTVQLLRDAGEV